MSLNLLVLYLAVTEAHRTCQKYQYFSLLSEHTVLGLQAQQSFSRVWSVSGFPQITHVLRGSVCFLWHKDKHKFTLFWSPCTTVPAPISRQRAVGDDGLTANEKLNNPSAVRTSRNVHPQSKALKLLPSYKQCIKCARSRCWPCWTY